MLARFGVTVEGLGSKSVQGDMSFVDILEHMGCHVERKADAVVLCSSDAEHAQLAPAMIDALKAAGSQAPVIIAGPPQDALPVADYIHVRSNAVETLKAWQARLGVKE